MNALVAGFREQAALAWSSVDFDFRIATKHFFRNVIGGSILVPRIVRAVIYRLLGFQFNTANIAEAQVILCPPSHLTIDRDVTVSRGCYFEGSGRTSIGARTLIGQEVAFITSAHAVNVDGSIDRTPTYRDIVVGADCWIGARAMLLGGARLANGCIVTAGSVVGGECESGFVYSGVPARKVGRVSALVGAGQS